MRVRLSWVWCGRIIALVAVGLLGGYLWRVGLSKANALAGVLSLLVAVVALAAPYLLPPASQHDGSLPELAGSAHPGAKTDAHLTPEGGARGLPLPSAAPARAQDPASAKESWIAAVMMFTDMQDPDFRRAILRLMGDRLGLGQPFSVPYRPLARDHVVEIVDQCWNFRNPNAALRTLAGVLVSLRPDTRAAVNLEQILADSH